MSIEASSFFGKEAYRVKIEESEELSALIAEAEKCKGLPFDEKLVRVREIAKNAMKNAWEGSKSENAAERERCSDLVFKYHPLSDALKAKAGCCRYQAILFLILGAAAKLGDRHYIQSVPVGPRVNTCFNDVYDGQSVHHVSIFVDSLEDKTNNYSKDPTLYERPIVYREGNAFLSYFVKDGQVQAHSNMDYHFGEDGAVVKVKQKLTLSMSRRPLSKNHVETWLKSLNDLTDEQRAEILKWFERD